MRSVKNSHTSPRALKLAQHRAEAYAYKVQGHTVREIGRIMRLDPSTVHSYVVYESERVPRETREHAIGILLDGLDELRVSIHQQAIKGKIQAVAESRKLILARAALLGVRPASAHEVGANINWNIDLTQNITRNVTFKAPNSASYANDPPPQASWMDPGPRLIESKPVRPQFGSQPEPPAPPPQQQESTPPPNVVPLRPEPAATPATAKERRAALAERAKVEGGNWSYNSLPSVPPKPSGKGSWMA